MNHKLFSALTGLCRVVLLLLICNVAQPASAAPVACNFSISPEVHLFLAAGGEITVNIQAFGTPGDACAWTTQDGYTWIALSRVAGNGSGTLKLSVTANQTGAERSGMVRIAGRNFTVFQAADCSYTITVSNQVFNASGGTATLNITANSSACNWSVSESANWLTLTGAASGLGSKQIQFTVAPNNGPARQVNLIVTTPNKNFQFPITQYAACQYSLSTTNQIVSGGGGQFLFHITSNCFWEPTANVSWIKLAAGQHNGSGTHSYVVEANDGPARTGIIDVEGETLLVAQKSGCAFSIGPINHSIGAEGGSGVITIGASHPACQWTAESYSPFLSFSSAQGQGIGTVVYQVAANNGAARSGSATVAGQSFSVAQAAAPLSAPALTSLSPSGTFAGGPDFTLTVTGTNFTVNSRVRWNGAERPTSFTSATQLQALITATDIATEGAASVTVQEPSEPVLNTLKFMIFGAVANVSAASFNGETLAPESLVSAYGVRLATQTAIAGPPPLPNTLAGTQVLVRDSQGVEVAAQLFFVSPNQINYLMPAGLALGRATVTVISGDGQVAVGATEIATAAPGLFTADASGKGLASAIALRVRAGGQQSFEPIARFESTRNAFQAVPIDLSMPDEQVYLVLFGTGFRHRSALEAVKSELGGIEITPLYAGAVPGLLGVDQINLPIPASLAGRELTDVVVKVDGKPANTVKVSFK